MVNVKNVQNNMDNKKQKQKGSTKWENDVKHKGMVVKRNLLRYSRRGIVTVMKSHSALKGLLVDPP